MIYCPKCGRELPDEAMFCAACGESLLRPDRVMPAPVEAEEKVPEAPEASSGEEPERFFEPAGEPAETSENPEKPAKKHKNTDDPFAKGSEMLAVVGFASAFIAPFAAIILCALAKIKGGKAMRRTTYSRLAGWGLFLGIVFTLATLALVAAKAWFGQGYLRELRDIAFRLLQLRR